MPVAQTETVDSPFSTDLVADGGDPATATRVGEILVWNDASDLHVKYQITESDWCLTETRLHIAADDGDGEPDEDEIPQSKGNPVPGQFDYQGTHDCVTIHSYQVPLTWSAGTELLIAADAKVANQGSEQTTVVYSDLGLTQVIAGNVPGATYPYPAVDAYEAQLDPPDPYASWADATLVLGGERFYFGPADWVWESYQPVDHTTTECVTFQHQFTTEGYVTGATLYITADNTHSVSLNGAFLGEDLNPFAWQSVEAYSVSLLDGQNVLDVEACNLGTPDWPLWANPAGLIYEIRIASFTTESAWGAGYDFPGSNWATYFIYTVEDASVSGAVMPPVSCAAIHRKFATFCAI